jgi:hypothetical protein
MIQIPGFYILECLNRIRHSKLESLEQSLSMNIGKKISAWFNVLTQTVL